MIQYIYKLSRIWDSRACCSEPRALFAGRQCPVRSSNDIQLEQPTELVCYSCCCSVNVYTNVNGIKTFVFHGNSIYPTNARPTRNYFRIFNVHSHFRPQLFCILPIYFYEQIFDLNQKSQFVIRPTRSSSSHRHFDMHCTWLHEKRVRPIHTEYRRMWCLIITNWI